MCALSPVPGSEYGINVRKARISVRISRQQGLHAWRRSTCSQRCHLAVTDTPDSSALRRLHTMPCRSSTDDKRQHSSLQTATEAPRPQGQNLGSPNQGAAGPLSGARTHGLTHEGGGATRQTPHATVRTRGATRQPGRRGLAGEQGVRGPAYQEPSAAGMKCANGPGGRAQAWRAPPWGVEAGAARRVRRACTF